MRMAPTTSIEDSNSFYTDVQKVSIISKEKKIKIGKNKKTKGNDPFLLDHFTYLLICVYACRREDLEVPTAISAQSH